MSAINTKKVKDVAELLGLSFPVLSSQVSVRFVLDVSELSEVDLKRIEPLEAAEFQQVNEAEKTLTLVIALDDDELLFNNDDVTFYK